MIESVLNKLQGVKSTGKNRWIAKCPAHDDKSPSLALSIADSGNVLMKCFCGCENQSILDAIGCDWKDLFADSADTHANKKQKMYASEGLKLIKDETRFFLKCMYSYRNGTLTNADIQALERRMPKLQNVFKDCGL